MEGLFLQLYADALLAYFAGAHVDLKDPEAQPGGRSTLTGHSWGSPPDFRRRV